MSWTAPLEQLSRERGQDKGDILTSFLTLTLCALSAGRQEVLYLEEAKHWNKDQLNLMSSALAHLINEMEAKPYTDLLGEVYTEWTWTKARQKTGEYYTPQEVCDLMAEITISAPPNKRPITLCEPACGSGRMILASAKVLEKYGIAPQALWVQATDVSRYACFMTFINTTLWGIPCQVIHGDTLRMTTHSTYENIFWYPLPFQVEPETNKVLEPAIQLGGESVQRGLFDEAA